MFEYFTATQIDMLSVVAALGRTSVYRESHRLVMSERDARRELEDLAAYGLVELEEEQTDCYVVRPLARDFVATINGARIVDEMLGTPCWFERSNESA